MRPDEVDELPLYRMAIMMGALSPDHENLSLTAKDMHAYGDMKKWNKRV